MLDLILSLFVALLVGFALLKCHAPVWVALILTLCLGVSLGYFSPQIVGLDQTAYADLLGVGPLNLLYQQSNGNILTAIQLSNEYGPYLFFIVIGFNLIATSIGFALGYGLSKVKIKAPRKH